MLMIFNDLLYLHILVLLAVNTKNSNKTKQNFFMTLLNSVVMKVFDPPYSQFFSFSLMMLIQKADPNGSNHCYYYHYCFSFICIIFVIFLLLHFLLLYKFMFCNNFYYTIITVSYTSSWFLQRKSICLQTGSFPPLSSFNNHFFCCFTKPQMHIVSLCFKTQKRHIQHCIFCFFQEKIIYKKKKITAITTYFTWSFIRNRTKKLLNPIYQIYISKEKQNKKKT